MNANEHDVKVVFIIAIALVVIVYIMAHTPNYEKNALLANGFVYVPSTWDEPAKWVKGEAAK